MQEPSIEDRIRHRVRAGMVNPRTMRLEITRDEARRLVQSIYNHVNSQYVTAMQEENGEKNGVLDNLHNLRTALKEKQYERIIDNVPDDVFGVLLSIKEDDPRGRAGIHGRDAVDSAEKRRYSDN